MRIQKNGTTIQSVDDWFRLAPPKEGARQWKVGRSAKELAKYWFPQPGGPQLPSDFNSLLDNHPDLAGIEIIEGTPEHKISLDNFRGETRNADLVLIGIRGDKRVSINIEAKADETFDQTISKKLRSVKNPRSKIPDRIDLMCKALFGETPKSDSKLLNLRYQLLTGCAGTLIESSRVDAQIAVFLVQVFISDAVNYERVRSNDNDYDGFLRSIDKSAAEKIPDGSLIGPITVPGGRFVPSDIPLYLGKFKTKITIL